MLAICLAWTACLLVTGCAGPREWTPEDDPNALSDEAFQAYLAQAPLVTVDETYRAILILADGEDTCTTFEERRQKLESRGLVNPKWKLQPGNVIDAGSVAYMVCKLCEITGGVNMHSFSAIGLGDRRYATKELTYREMLEDTVDYQYLTGAALIGLMAKADALMEEKGLYEAEPIDLSDETDRDAQGNLIVPPSPAEPSTPRTP